MARGSSSQQAAHPLHEPTVPAEPLTARLRDTFRMVSAVLLVLVGITLLSVEVADRHNDPLLKPATHHPL